MTQKPMKQIKDKLNKHPLPAPVRPGVLVVRTERRSWFTIAFTAFGAILLRYLKIQIGNGRAKRPICNQ